MNILLRLFVVITLGFLVPVNASCATVDASMDNEQIQGAVNSNDEILFRSKISPYRKSCDISVDECNEIIKNTRLVLKEAIKKGGTTIKSFTSSEGVHGLFQNELLVHGKKKGICPNCSSSIQVCRIAGRGTYYCPKCQK